MSADKRQELERILEMICDRCHLTYVIRDQEKMMDKCGACPIEDAIKALIEQSAGCEADGQNIRLPVPLGGKIYTAGVTEELDGRLERWTEELTLSGYAKEGERECYLTYDPDKGGTCDVAPDRLYLTPEAAAAASERMLMEWLEKKHGMSAGRLFWGMWAEAQPVDDVFLRSRGKGLRCAAVAVDAVHRTAVTIFCGGCGQLYCHQASGREAEE